MVIYVAVYLPTFTDVVWTKLTRCFARLISIGMQLHIYILHMFAGCGLKWPLVLNRFVGKISYSTYWCKGEFP